MFYLMDVELKVLGHNLDDVIRVLYEENSIYEEQKISPWLTSKTTIEEVSGQDFTDFFDKYITGTDIYPIDPSFFVWICHNNNPEE